MTIKQAIAQLLDLRKDRESFAKTDESGGVFDKDIEAIDVAVKALEENAEIIKQAKEIDINAAIVQKEYERETAELKRLLRLAVEEMTKQKLYADLGMMSRRALCKSCKTRSVTNRICQVCNYEYEHAEEALEVLADEK